MENSELESRVAKLEKQSASRFFVQYLLSPLLVLAVGAVMNYRVEQNKTELEKAKSDIQRIDLAQKMIPILFAGNPQQAFATQRLMEKVLDADVAKEFKEVITSYYKAKVESDLKKGDITSAVETLNAAQSIGGQSADQVVQSVTQDHGKSEVIQKYTNKVQLASQKEREGFENLIAGKYDDAIKSFQAAEEAYNSYHQVYEIAKLLRTRRSELDDDNGRKKMFQLMVDNYSYGAPSDLLNQLKIMAKP
jgi:hypothetical protein